MVLTFFIEKEENAGRATPFNILPLGAARSRDFLELAAILPSSPLDLTHGWVRPRHSLGLVPLINFYSEKDVEILLKDRISLAKLPDKLFLARKEFSTGLIDGCSTEATPSILVTDNANMGSYFQRKNNVRVVQYKAGQSRPEVYRRCYRELIDLFTARKEKDFSDESISMEFSESFCLAKSFLPETNVTSNVLCNANEIVMAQTRGKFPNFLSIEESPPLQTEEAYKSNTDSMKEILAERLVDIIAGVACKEQVIHPKRDFLLIEKTVKEFLSQLPQMSREEKERKYSHLKEIALRETEKIYSRNETILLVPTVNSACRRKLVSELQKTVPVADRDKLDYIIEQILLGGREILVSKDRLNKVTEKIAAELANTRLAENKFLTNLIGLLASRRLSPVLKSTTAPSSLFEDFLALRAYVGLGLLSERENIKWTMTIGERFRYVQTRLGSHIPQVYMNAIETTNPSNITIVSDLPFEFAQFGNGMAISQMFPTTRIPITPLGSTFSFYNQTLKKGFVGEKMKSLENVLLLNSIHKDDKVYNEFQHFQSISRSIGLNFKTETVLSKDEFISAMNSTKSQILIYFGHSSYNDQKDVGELIFRDDRLSFNDLGKTRKIPPIMFLIGCETASCSAFFGGLPAHLLERGVSAILASIFPIPAEEAGAFLGRILSYADDIVRRKQLTDFSELVFEARKVGWMRDNLDYLWTIGAISNEEGADIMKETSDIARNKSFKRGRSIPLMEATKIFEKVLESHNVLNVWKEGRRNVVPYSLFFTLLGDAHNVLIGGG